MDEEDGHTPRSTEEAYVALRADAAKRVLAHPEAMPQPWSKSRTDGWPVSEAVFTFTPESTRGQVSLHLGLAAGGYALPDILERLALYGWRFVRERLSRGDLRATGFAVGKIESMVIPSSLFDQAQFDPLTGQVSGVSDRFSGVRVFVPDVTPPTATSVDIIADTVESPIKQAVAWMEGHVTAYVANQRDDRVTECAAELGISRSKAKSAWMTLPEAIRGRSRQSR